MANDPLIGSTVGGCIIVEIIGQGGMGVIYKARQKSLDRIIALKVLARHLANDIQFVTRFQKEARAIARVNHPNILAVYDVGDDQNTNYMIMELIDGQSLAELQNDRRGAIPWEEACDYVRQAAQGLEAAQAAGIIHRDIKPENLMVTKKNVIKVSDFGLAKEADSGNTSVDAVMGTPAFMSPEQCDGKKVDGRSDIYSLGGTFYRLVTGRLPFEAETAMSMMYRHKHEALIPPHEVVPTVPDAVSEIIVKMMAKKREQRYQTLTEVIDAMEVTRRPQSAGSSGGAHFAVPGAVMVSASGSSSAYQPVVAGTPAQMPPPPQIPVMPPPPSSMRDDNSGMFVAPHQSGMHVRVVPNSGRMPAQPNPMSGFGSNMDSSSGINMPSSIGLAPAGLQAPDDGYTNVTRGDEMIGRGERINGLKQYRDALKSRSLDNTTRQRIEGELRKEAATRRSAAESLLKRGMLVEASRECRVLVELDPADDYSKGMLKELDSKLAAKRTMVNDIRTAIAASDFERAIKLWEKTPSELHDEGVAKQVEQLRNVIVPSIKLAEEGDNLSSQGRLEEAISAYEDALKYNPACEPARIGLKDTEQKVQRIEFLLKEGFQHSLDQNYSKAIETWKPILDMRPGHPQAIKSIVDAYMAAAQNLRAHGDLEGAMQAYEGASATDPDNTSARRMSEELTNLRDKEEALVKRAQDAGSHHRYTAAIGYWKEVQRINPTGKRAGQQISILSRQRGSSMLKSLMLVVVIAALAGAGYQYYMERKVIRDATVLVEQHRYDEAVRELRNARILLHTAERDELIKKAALEVDVADAMLLQQQQKYSEAADKFLAMASRMTDLDKKRAAEYSLRALVNKARQLDVEGAKALNNSKPEWDTAMSQYGDIKLLLQDKQITPEIATLQRRSDQAISLIQKAKNAEGEVDKGKRFIAWKSALEYAIQLNFTATQEFIKSRFENYDEARFNDLMSKGKTALRAAPPDINAAHTFFQDALKDNPVDEARVFVQFTDDLLACDKDNMSLQSNGTPLRGNQSWGNEQRNSAFCIDRYEYPNVAGKMPDANLNWLAAKDACVKAGKSLCSPRQWSDACKGGELTFQFPYGTMPVAGKCNTEGDKVMASGSRAECRNAIGLYDMSGNLAEWTDNSVDGDASTQGGSFSTLTRNADCESEIRQKQTGQDPRTGFRCCRPLLR